MKRILMTTGIAVLAFATVVGAQSATFTRNLTTGSTGADVTALQNWLIQNGFHIPAIETGAAQKGYFGSQTKAAVSAYQKSVGLPSYGFFGPLTIARITSGGGSGGNSGSSGSNNCMPGWTPVTYQGSATCVPPGYGNPNGTANNGTSNNGTSPTTITTPGAEGILTVTSGPISSTNLNVGQTMVPVLVARVQAQNSDIAIQRLQIDLGTDTRIFNKIFSKLYVKDPSGNVLASVPLVLNQSVVNSGNNYYVTIAGFSYVVPKGTTRDLTVAADLYSAIDSTLTTAGSNSGLWKMALATNGVRGIDGAAVNQYGPLSGSTATYTDGNGTSNTLTNNTVLSALTVAGSLVDNAKLTVSTDNPLTPVSGEVIANGGSNSNQASALPILAFDLKADKDNIQVKDMTVSVQVSGAGSATVSTVYLFDGSTQVGSASVSSGQATFSNIYYNVPIGPAKTLTLKADVTGATASSNTITASTTSSITALNSQGSTVTVSGNGSSNSTIVRNTGVQITLVSKSISGPASSQTSGSNNISTTTLQATFVLNVKAIGSAIQIGTNQASSSPFAASNTPAVGVKSFAIYRGGTVDNTISSFATSTIITVDSSCSTGSLTNTCQISDGNTSQITVQFSILGRSATAALTPDQYAVQLTGLNWGGQTSTFFSTDANWRTNAVTFP